MTLDRKSLDFIRETARRHAEAGTWLLVYVINAVNGKRPEWSPITDARHSAAADAIGQVSSLEEHKASLRQQNEEISLIGEPPALLIIKANLFGAIEVLGCTMLMTAFGYPRPENIFFGVAAAAGIFALVGLSRRARDPWKYAGLAALALIAVTISRMRMDDVQSDADGAHWALAIITLLASLGPAFLAEPVLRKLVALFPSLIRRYHTRREHDALDKSITKAHELRNGIAAEIADHDEKRVLITANYTLAFNERCGELGLPPHYPTDDDVA